MDNEKQLQTQEQTKIQETMKNQIIPEKPPIQEPPKDQKKPKKSTAKNWWLLLTLFILAGIFIFIAVGGLTTNQESGKNPPSAETEKNQPAGNEDAVETTFSVTEIIDGDTIVIEGGNRVRLLEIDAADEGSPCYNEATKRLEELILKKEVKLVKETTDKDQYDRLLRYVFLNEENINLELVKEGLAICKFIEPDIKYKEDCLKLEAEARSNKTGCKWQEKIIIELPKELNWENLTPEKTGLEIIKAEEVKSQVGKEKIVEGKTASIKKSSNPALYINFCQPYPNQCFMAVILNNDWQKFPSNADALYEQKTVRVKGTIQQYKGQPEIVLRDPSQIEIGK